MKTIFLSVNDDLKYADEVKVEDFEESTVESAIGNWLQGIDSWYCFIEDEEIRVYCWYGDCHVNYSTCADYSNTDRWFNIDKQD